MLFVIDEFIVTGTKSGKEEGRMSPVPEESKTARAPPNGGAASPGGSGLTPPSADNAPTDQRASRTCILL